MKLTACLIVKDSVGHIEACLDSIRRHVDEICIYDTGSTDGTLELLARLAESNELLDVSDDGETRTIPLAPIKVEQGEWRNDFSWAREQSFAMAADADWHLWLDDDDVVVGAEKFRSLAATAHHALDGFVIYYDYARDPVTGQTVCELWRERLIRNHERFHWVNPVHEIYVLKDDQQPYNFLKIPAEQARYIHNRVEERYDPTRNLAILEAALAADVEAERLPDLRTLAYLGTEKMAHGDFAGAASHLQAYLEDERTTVGDERSQVAHKFALCAAMLGNIDAALEIEFTAIKERDDWTENAVGLCEFFAQKMDWKRAETWARRVIEQGKPDTVLILNPLDFTYLPFMRLSEALAGQDRWDEAKEWFAKAAVLIPNHPQLPEKAQALEWDSLVAKTVSSILQLREVCIRYDENWKAHQLLENVPYFVADNPAIVAARAMTRENVMHALKPEEYQRWYQDEPKQSSIPDNRVEKIGDHIPRAAFLLELAQKFEAEHGRKPRMLDMGSNDAWLSCYLWLNGEYVCDGIELNKDAHKKGLKRLETFGCPARTVQGNILDAHLLLGEEDDSEAVGQWFYYPSYDIISMFEVYEHVPDVNAVLDELEALVDHEVGYIAVTTPNGAYDSGNVPLWHLVERKGHLRAVGWKEFLKSLADRNGKLSEVRVHHDNRLTYAVYRPGPRRPKVIFHAGGAWEPWSPASIKTGGIGGSETALSQVAIRLAYYHDFDVRVYADAAPGVYAGSLWLPTASFDPTEEADAIISSRNPNVFGVELHADVRALWCHDVEYDVSPDQFERITDVITLSDWQRAWWAEKYPEQADKLRVIRNGIATHTMDDEPLFPHGHQGFEQRKPKVIYSSSADRGLDVLLEVWPHIRRRVPEAELHVFYGWETFDKIARVRPELRAYRAKIEELLEGIGGEDGGVFMRGRLGQHELYTEFQEARVWAYPTNFCETSCITAMEVRAAGCAIVTTDLAALSETVSDEHGILLLPTNSDEAYQERFAKNVVDLLSKPDFWLAWHRKAIRDVDQLTWDRRVEEWAALIQQSMQSPNRKGAVIEA